MLLSAPRFLCALLQFLIIFFYGYPIEGWAFLTVLTLRMRFQALGPGSH